MRLSGEIIEHRAFPDFGTVYSHSVYCSIDINIVIENRESCHCSHKRRSEARSRTGRSVKDT